MQTITIGSLKCEIFPGDSDEICYLLMPIMIDHKTTQAIANQTHATWVYLSGMDWDNDLTPWPAPNVPSTLPPFAGHAAEFLKKLKEKVLPAVEGVKKYTKRSLCGISLSGLFTLWAWMQDDTFADMGSISGSFWYPGIVEWLQANVKAKSGKAYFSLGVKEGGPHVPKAFQDVQQRTQQVIDILQKAGIECHFDATPGNHYANPAPRLALMAQYLYS